MASPRKISIERARRVALRAQGFGKTSSKPGVRGFRRVMADLGLIQLDSVNVCVRTHYMPFYSRLGPYNRLKLDQHLNGSGEYFEYWAHEAAVLPVEKLPLWRWKMQTAKPWKAGRELQEQHPEMLESVLAQVRTHGPLTVRELDIPSDRKRPWWGYGPGKIALEVLFLQGALGALRTKNFGRLYDLPERMFPQALLDDLSLDQDAAHRQLVLEAVGHLGIGTLHDIADYFRLKSAAVAPVLAQLAEEGLVHLVEVPSWRGPVYLDPQATCPRKSFGTSLLSPFDPVLWFRQRAERLFDFHYRIEIYTPAEKRVHGYYVLPFMLDGEIVARVDLKADRKQAVLLVQSAFVEAGQNKQRVAKALTSELKRFAQWLDLGDIRLGRSGDLAATLRKLL